jgi:hypothetical protein
MFFGHICDEVDDFGHIYVDQLAVKQNVDYFSRDSLLTRL